MTKKQVTILAFVKMLDEELNVSFNDDGYYFLTAENIVNVDLSLKDDCGFLNHLKTAHKCEFVDEFDLNLWSILHEVGHYETEGYITESDDEQDLRLLLSITDETMAHNPEIQKKYYNLSSEWYATEWAIEWISENYEMAKEMNKIF